MSPAKRRKLILRVCHKLAVSERRACDVLEQSRATQQYNSSDGGDSIALVYSDIELLMEGLAPQGGAMFPFEFETPDIGMTTLGMVIYLVVGFVSSIWISNRRQLA